MRGEVILGALISYALGACSSSNANETERGEGNGGPLSDAAIGDVAVGGTGSSNGASTNESGAEDASSSGRDGYSNEGGSGGNAEGGTGDGGANCDPALAAADRALVAKAIDELFVRKDISAVDRYWADPYDQHNPIAKSGVVAFKSLMASLISAPAFSYQALLVLAECDLAVVYGRYSQTGIIFDMFRVRDGKIVEHWDSDANQASESSGIGARDDAAPTARTEQLFLDFASVVLLPGAWARAGGFLSDTYVEHHGTRASGSGAFAAFVTNEAVTYTAVHHSIADGNFVFALSQGNRGATSFGFYDLFRAADGKLVEHWDSRRVVPSSTMSGLGIF